MELYDKFITIKTADVENEGYTKVMIDILNEQGYHGYTYLEVANCEDLNKIIRMKNHNKEARILCLEEIERQLKKMGTCSKCGNYLSEEAAKRKKELATDGHVRGGKAKTLKKQKSSAENLKKYQKNLTPEQKAENERKRLEKFKETIAKRKEQQERKKLEELKEKFSY